MGVKKTIKRTATTDCITVQEAFIEFMQEKTARNLSESTLRNYKQSYEFFLRYNDLTEETATEEIKQNQIYKMINTLKLNGTKASSINHYLRDIRTFMYWCMDEDRAYIEPFKVIMVEKQEESLKMFSDEEIQALLLKPRKNDSFTDWRTWAIVNWVLGTGNRASTICSVKIGDINYNKKEITLAHTKNKKAQIIPLSSSLETVLKQYTKLWRAGTKKNDWLFPSIADVQLTTNALRHSFQRYCEARNVEHTNIHGLRHNFAKYWVQNNGNMFALQQILGHSSLEMTRRYVKLFSEDIKEDFDKYSPLDTIKRNSKRTQKVHRSEYY